VNGFQLDNCERKPFFKDIDLTPGKQRLGRVAAMLSRIWVKASLTIMNDWDSIDKDSDKDSDKDGKIKSEM
jgi:hypothetical protein